MPDAEPLTPPTVLPRADVVLAQPPPSVPTVLCPQRKSSPLPPQSHRKGPPKPAEPRPKPLPTAKRPLPGPPPGPETKTFEKPKPGILTPMPDEGPASAGANTLGPSIANNPTDQPAKPIEGGEAGAGELSDQGDLPPQSRAPALAGAAAALGVPGSARALREAGPASEAYDLAPGGWARWRGGKFGAPTGRVSALASIP